MISNVSCKKVEEVGVVTTMIVELRHKITNESRRFHFGSNIVQFPIPS